MQGWMVALIAVAFVIAFLCIAFLIGALVSVRLVLGRRKGLVSDFTHTPDPDAERFGADLNWFVEVKDLTRELAITSFDGIKLYAKLVKHETPCDRVAIVCHGYGATPRSVQALARLFYDKGFDVLFPVMRGHAQSGGKVGMAWFDRFDILRWTDKAIALYGENVKIAIGGMSMGGASVIAAAGMNPPPQVKCVIDDCGFDTLLNEYKVQVKGIHLPYALSLAPIRAGTRLVHGYSVDDVDITRFSAQIKIPALFIHGEADRFVPVELGRRLYNACSSPDKTFVGIGGASHGCAYVTDREKYSAEVNGFIDRVLGN